jgi:uncharacterized surface anchored protein
VSLTFVDPRQRGAISITKTAKHKDTSGNTSPNLVAGFTIKDSNGAQVGTEVFTNASGQACVGNLLLGDYTVNETTVPSGYAGDPDTETAHVTTSGTCASGPTAPVSFQNTPLTNITVSVDSQVPGGTASTITCNGSSGATGPDGDGSLTVSNKVPGTYTCTIVVDP